MNGRIDVAAGPIVPSGTGAVKYNFVRIVLPADLAQRIVNFVHFAVAVQHLHFLIKYFMIYCIIKQKGESTMNFDLPTKPDARRHI